MLELKILTAILNLLLLLEQPILS